MNSEGFTQAQTQAGWATVAQGPFGGLVVPSFSQGGDERGFVPPIAIVGDATNSSSRLDGAVRSVEFVVVVEEQGVGLKTQAWECCRPGRDRVTEQPASHRGILSGRGASGDASEGLALSWWREDGVEQGGESLTLGA